MTPAKSGMCLAFLAEKRKKMNRKNNERKRRNSKSRKDVIMPVSASENQMPDSYSVFLGNLKKRIQQERLKVVLSANAALVMMYWDIGRSILQKQNNEGWGAKVIDRLSLDLKYAFPEMSGFSPRNLKYMRKFAESCLIEELCKRCLHKLPGIIIWLYWKKLKSLNCVCGMPGKHLRMVGVEMFLFSRLKPVCMNESDRPPNFIA